MLQACPNLHCRREATGGGGGLASVLDEFAQAASVAIWSCWARGSAANALSSMLIGERLPRIC